MKVHHRKTHWIHAVFSIGLLLALMTIVLIKRDIPTMVLALAFTFYVVGNSLIHLRRGDLNQETVIEYTLLTLAVFIVMASAFASN